MFTLIDMNNKESYGVKFIGIKSNFNYDGNKFYFSSMRSSRVKSISLENNTMIIKTKNSVYTFKKED